MVSASDVLHAESQADHTTLHRYFGLIDGEDKQRQYDVHEMYYDGGSKVV